MHYNVPSISTSPAGLAHTSVSRCLRATIIKVTSRHFGGVALVHELRTSSTNKTTPASSFVASSGRRLGIYLAVNPLDTFSRMLEPFVLGDVHYQTAHGVQKLCTWCKCAAATEPYLIGIGATNRTTLALQCNKPISPSQQLCAKTAGKRFMCLLFPCRATIESARATAMTATTRT